MFWYIRDIVIYGRGEEVRHLSFEPGVNVITGDSQTGKSALIAIVDYCLGSGEYEVPVGVIRDFATWYAIRLQTPDEQIFVARKEPGGRRNTDTMHLIVRREVIIPSADELVGNSSRDAVIEELSARLGMMQQPLADSVLDKAYTEPPNVRNVAPFLYQPQGVIANKDQLFYRVDEQRHREHRSRLQRVFPYVLGAVNAEYFQTKGDLDKARRELKQQERLLSERQALSGDGLSVARALWDRAIALSLGRIELWDDDPNVANDLDLPALHARLLRVVDNVRNVLAREPAIATDPERASALDSQSRSLRSEITSMRRELSEIKELSDSAEGYAGALRLQRDRLRSIDLLPALSPGNEVCPVCSQSVDGLVPTIERIRAINRDVEAELDGLGSVGPRMAHRISELEQQVAHARYQLVQVESELSQLYQIQEEANSATAAWAEQERLIGAIRFYLDRAPMIPGDIEVISRRVDELRRRVERLEHELEQFDTGDRLESALVAIAHVMADMSKRFNLEHPDAGLRLDIKRLTVIRTPAGGKPQRLNEIGSGENWVGYHLCALFALHTYFARMGSPVPSFLFLDQPSQIYFPQEAGDTLSSGGPQPEQTDWAAVRNIYRMVFQAVVDMDNLMQVIIVDHADLTDPPEFHQSVRYRWRHGQKLI